MIYRIDKWLIWILLACVCACSGEAAHESAAGAPTKKDSVLLDFHSVSTALEILPLRQLPAGFYLDSMQETDQGLNHQIILYYPVSQTDQVFNRKLRLFMEKHAAGYKPDEKGDEYQSSSFDLWLIAEEHSGKKQRFTFRMQSYYPGAAHYNHDSAVFSYQVK